MHLLKVTPLKYRSVPFSFDPVISTEAWIPAPYLHSDHWFSFAIGAFDEVGNGKTFLLIFFHVLNRLESGALAVSCIPTRSLITEQDTSLFMFPLYSKEHPARNTTRMQNCEEENTRDRSTFNVQHVPAVSLSWTILVLNKRVKIIIRMLIISW